MGNLPLNPEPDGNVRGSEPHRTSEPLSAQQLAVMHSAIEDSHFSNSSMPDILMPWEMPALSMVFGESEEPIIPSVRPILGYVEPPQIESVTERPPMSLQPKTTAFEHAISFESKGFAICQKVISSCYCYRSGRPSFRSASHHLMLVLTLQSLVMNRGFPQLERYLVESLWAP